MAEGNQLILNNYCPRALTCDYLFITLRRKFYTKDNFEGLAVMQTGLPVVIKEQASSSMGKACYNSKQNTAK